MNKSPVERQNLPHFQKRKWKYTNDDTLGGECFDCGLWYGSSGWVDVHLPDDIWELISPSSEPGHGLLCFTCINRRLEFLGLEGVPFEIGSGPLYKNRRKNEK